ncbi:hypothetical protein IC229_14245 [Spirosoma sp. BT702]|uniref:DUF1440 domain-containing protein n=1 Tax=Spirosoma profusum TaxID=2771354 RepID=A0A926Y1G2_9BACT|nr:hypothetical protein [Spirosoma profusum]MBD2701808.1 hypothetical protein [Spirosoma profusum]
MAPSTTYTRSKALRTIISAGLTAGVLDALAAMTMLMIRGGKNPLAVWSYVASAAFGQEALTGGTPMVVWGLVFHFFIALTFAGFFFLIFPAIRQYINQPVIVGLLYGIFVWLIMNRVVIPLSKLPAQPFDLSKAWIGIVIIMVFVGLPIALIVNRNYVAR